MTLVAQLPSMASSPRTAIPAPGNASGSRKARCPKCTATFTEPSNPFYECPICSTLLMGRANPSFSNTSTFGKSVDGADSTESPSLMSHTKQMQFNEQDNHDFIRANPTLLPKDSYELKHDPHSAKTNGLISVNTIQHSKYGISKDDQRCANSHHDTSKQFFGRRRSYLSSANAEGLDRGEQETQASYITSTSDAGLSSPFWSSAENIDTSISDLSVGHTEGSPATGSCITDCTGRPTLHEEDNHIKQTSEKPWQKRFASHQQESYDNVAQNSMFEEANPGSDLQNGFEGPNRLTRGSELSFRVDSIDYSSVNAATSRKNSLEVSSSTVNSMVDGSRVNGGFSSSETRYLTEMPFNEQLCGNHGNGTASDVKVWNQPGIYNSSLNMWTPEIHKRVGQMRTSEGLEYLVAEPEEEGLIRSRSLDVRNSAGLTGGHGGQLTSVSKRNVFDRLEEVANPLQVNQTALQRKDINLLEYSTDKGNMIHNQQQTTSEPYVYPKVIPSQAYPYDVEESRCHINVGSMSPRVNRAFHCQADNTDPSLYRDVNGTFIDPNLRGLRNWSWQERRHQSHFEKVNHVPSQYTRFGSTDYQFDHDPHGGAQEPNGQIFSGSIGLQQRLSSRVPMRTPLSSSYALHQNQQYSNVLPDQYLTHKNMMFETSSHDMHGQYYEKQASKQSYVDSNLFSSQGRNNKSVRRKKYYPPMPGTGAVPYVLCNGCHLMLEVPTYLPTIDGIQKLKCNGCGQVSKFGFVGHISKQSTKNNHAGLGEPNFPNFTGMHMPHSRDPTSDKCEPDYFQMQGQMPSMSNGFENIYRFRSGTHPQNERANKEINDVNNSNIMYSFVTSNGVPRPNSILQRQEFSDSRGRRGDSDRFLSSTPGLFDEGDLSDPSFGLGWSNQTQDDASDWKSSALRNINGEGMKRNNFISQSAVLRDRSRASDMFYNETAQSENPCLASSKHERNVEHENCHFSSMDINARNDRPTIAPGSPLIEHLNNEFAGHLQNLQSSQNPGRSASWSPGPGSPLLERLAYDAEVFEHDDFPYPKPGNVNNKTGSGQDVGSKGPKFLASIFRKSFKEFGKGSQSTNSKQKVFINGHMIPESTIKAIQSRTGLIRPGSYWYDYQAGFWGAMGGPCLGIIPPFIEEFKFPLSKDCAGGRTGILINGRELHEKDLDVLAARGLPATAGKSYMLDISGQVIDNDSGKQLPNLGRLAPTIEKRGRGYGMFQPRNRT